MKDGQAFNRKNLKRYYKTDTKELTGMFTDMT